MPDDDLPVLVQAINQHLNSLPGLPSSEQRLVHDASVKLQEALDPYRDQLSSAALEQLVLNFASDELDADESDQ